MSDGGGGGGLWSDGLPEWLAWAGGLTQLQLVLIGIMVVVFFTMICYIIPLLKETAFTPPMKLSTEEEAKQRLLQSTVPIFVLTPIEMIDLSLRPTAEVDEEVEYTEEARRKRAAAERALADARATLALSTRRQPHGEQLVVQPYVVLTIGPRTMKTRVASMFKEDVSDQDFTKARFWSKESFYVPVEQRDLGSREAASHLVLYAQVFHHDVHAPSADLRLAVGFYDLQPILTASVDAGDAATVSGKAHDVSIELHGVFSGSFRLMVERRTVQMHPAIDNQSVIIEDASRWPSHGGFVGVAVSFVQSPRWMQVLKALQPRVHALVVDSLDLPHRVMLLMQHNPVLSAYGLVVAGGTQQIEYSTGKPLFSSMALELPVLLDANAPGRLDLARVGHGTRAQTMFLAAFKRPMFIDEDIMQWLTDAERALSVSDWLDLFCAALNIAVRGSRFKPLAAELRPEEVAEISRRRAFMMSMPADGVGSAYTVLTVDERGRQVERQPNANVARLIGASLGAGGGAGGADGAGRRYRAQRLEEEMDLSGAHELAAKEGEGGGAAGEGKGEKRVELRGGPASPRGSIVAALSSAAAGAREAASRLGSVYAPARAPAPASTPAHAAGGGGGGGGGGLKRVDEGGPSDAPADEDEPAAAEPMPPPQPPPSRVVAGRVPSRPLHSMRSRYKLTRVLSIARKQEEEQAAVTKVRWHDPLPANWLQHALRSEEHLASFLVSDSTRATAACVLSRRLSVAGGIHFEVRSMAHFGQAQLYSVATLASGPAGPDEGNAKDLTTAAASAFAGQAIKPRRFHSATSVSSLTNTAAVISDEPEFTTREIHAFVEALGKCATDAASVQMPSDELLALEPPPRVAFYQRLEQIEQAARKRVLLPGQLCVIDVLALLEEQGLAGSRLSKQYARDQRALDVLRLLQRTHYLTLGLYVHQVPLSAQGVETAVEIIERQPLLFPLGLLSRLGLPGALARGDAVAANPFDEPSPSFVAPEALVAEEERAVRMLTDHVKAEIDAGHHTLRETANASIVIWAHKLLTGRCKRSDQEYILKLMREEPPPDAAAAAAGGGVGHGGSSQQQLVLAPLGARPGSAAALKPAPSSMAVLGRSSGALTKAAGKQPAGKQPAAPKLLPGAAPRALVSTYRRGERAIQLTRMFGFKLLYLKFAGVKAVELCRLLRNVGYFSMLSLTTRIELVEWLVRLATSPASQEGIACVFEASAPDECAEIAEVIGLRLLHFALGGTYWGRFKAAFANSFLNPTSVYGARVPTDDPLELYRKFKLQITGMYEAEGKSSEKRKLRRKQEVDEPVKWKEAVGLLDTADVMLWSEAGAQPLPDERVASLSGFMQRPSGQSRRQRAHVYTHAGLVVRLRPQTLSQGLDEVALNMIDVAVSDDSGSTSADAERAAAPGGLERDLEAITSDTIVVVHARYVWAPGGRIERRTVLRTIPSFLSDDSISDVAIRHLIGENEESSDARSWLASLLTHDDLFEADMVALHCLGDVTPDRQPSEEMLTRRLAAELVATLYQRFGLLQTVTENGAVHPLALSSVDNVEPGGELNRLLVGTAWLGPPRRILRTPNERLPDAVPPLDTSGLMRELTNANLTRAARKAYNLTPKLSRTRPFKQMQPELSTGDLVFFHAGTNTACRVAQMVGQAAYCHVGIVLSVGLARPMLVEADPFAFTPDRALPAVKPARIVDLETRALNWLADDPTNVLAVRRLRGRSLRRRATKDLSPRLVQMHDKLAELPTTLMANATIAFFSSVFTEEFVVGVQLEAIKAGVSPFFSAHVVAHALAELGFLTAPPVAPAACRIRDLLSDGPTPSLPLAPVATWDAPVGLKAGR